MRQLNLLFLAGLLTILTVGSGAVFALHQFQVRRNASFMLDAATRLKRVAISTRRHDFSPST